MALSNPEKKARIIDAAGRVFSRKGFHLARMDEIAETAQVAKGTLYYNYASKSKLFAATVTQGLNEIMDTIAGEIESDLPFGDHFRQILSTLVRLYVSNSEVTRIYVNEMSSGIDPDVLAEIKAVRQRFNRFIEDQIRYGQDKGYLKSLPPHLGALGVIGIIDTLCSHHLEHPDQDELEKIIETVSSILSTGLTRPSGFH